MKRSSGTVSNARATLACRYGVPVGRPKGSAKMSAGERVAVSSIQTIRQQDDGGECDQERVSGRARRSSARARGACWQPDWPAGCRLRASSVVDPAVREGELRQGEQGDHREEHDGDRGGAADLRVADRLPDRCGTARCRSTPVGPPRVRAATESNTWNAVIEVVMATNKVVGASIGQRDADAAGRSHGRRRRARRRRRCRTEWTRGRRGTGSSSARSAARSRWRPAP